MNIFKAIGHLFKASYISVIHFFSGDREKQIAAEFAKAILAFVNQESVKVIRTIVLALENSSLDGAARLAEAVKQAKEQLTASGKSLPTIVIQLVINGVLAEVRGILALMEKNGEVAPEVPAQ